MQNQLVNLTGRVSNICKRNLGIFAPAMQKATDPIQQLFVDKLREYRSKSSGGKVPLTPDLQKEVEKDKNRVYKQFNVKPGEDLTKFPSFKFQDPNIGSHEI